MDREKQSTEISEHLTEDSVPDMELLTQKVLAAENREELLEDLFEQFFQPQTISQLEKYIEKNLEHIRQAYIKANHLKELGFFEEALDEIDDIVREIMPLNELIQSPDYDVLNFNEPFEFDLYEMLEPSKKIFHSPIPCFNLLCLHGNLLLALGRIEEAITSLGLALTWNPVSHDASILLAEAYKFNEDMEMLYALTIERFNTAFSKIHMAELYYNLGYYYGTIKQPDDAIACFTLCSRYGGQEIAASALYQMEKKYGRSFQWASDDQIEKSANTCGYPLVPDQQIIQLARMKATESYLDGDYDHAIYYIRIALDLSDSSEDRSFLDMLAEKNVVM